MVYTLYHEKSYTYDRKKKFTFVWADLAPTPRDINGLLGFIDLGSWRGAANSLLASL